MGVEVALQNRTYPVYLCPTAVPELTEVRGHLHHLPEKDGAVVREEEEYGVDLHAGVRVRVEDDEEMMQLLVVELRRLQLQLLQLVVVAELELQRGVVAWRLALLRQQHSRCTIDLARSCPRLLKNKNKII